MKKLLLIFVFAILSSCTVDDSCIDVIEQDDVICGEIVGRTEGRKGTAWTWYLTLEISEGEYAGFEVASEIYYNTYIGEYICLR